ncbi:MAG: hypothetical protein AAF705_07585 [Bacteroidota bacterium]
MKPFFITFHFCLLFIAGHSQTNYIPYFQKWIKVESLALLDQMEAAEKIILECFADYEPAFASDVVLAAQLAAINEHDSLSFLWIEKALKRGVKYNCINSMRVFKGMQQQPQWDSLQSKVKQLEYEYATSIRFDLNKEFMQRYYIEQEAKSKPEYEDVVSSNFNRIREIISSIGFPGERLVGLDVPGDPKKWTKCHLGNRKITVTFLHHPYSFSLLHDALLVALKNGKLHPDDFLYIYFFEFRKMGALYPKMRKPDIKLANYDHLLGKRDLSDDEIKQIDAARYELGIWPLKTQADRDNRKAIFDKYGILVGSIL